MKHLILILGLLLLAVPAQAQVTTFFARYVADGSAPGAIPALANGDKLCPPHSSDCRGYDQAHHHIEADVGGATGAYNTDVLDVSSCSFVTVCLKTTDLDGVTASAFIESVSENADTLPLQILADVNGDGVINAADEVPLDGDDGSDNDSDGTERQTACMYDITGHNKIQLAVQNGGGGVDEEAYIEVGCR